MNINNTILSFVLLVSFNVYAILGPIPITLETEYRTNSPMIGSIASTIKLDKADIQATGANTFLELLATIPSLNVFNTQGNIPALFIRGTEARHTLVLVDGVRVNDISSTDGAVGIALDNIPLEQIERVEIIKGAYSALYGSDVIGGIIQVFTKKPSIDGEQGGINLVIASHNTKKINLNSSAKSDKGFISFNASKYQTNGISARVDNTEKDGIDNQSFGFKIGYNVDKNTDIIIDFLTSGNQVEYDNCFGSDDCLNQTNLDKLTLKLTHQHSYFWQSELNLAHINQDKNLNNYQVAYQTTDITLLNNIWLNNALLSIGLSNIKDTNNTSNQSLSSQDIFTQWQKNIASIDTNVGLRFIDHSEFGNEVVYNFGFGKTFDNHIKITSAYGTAFKAPSIYQIYYQNTKDLKPETAHSFEIGVEQQYAWGVPSIKFYIIKVKNLIDYLDVNNDSNTPNFIFSDDIYINQSKLETKGIELAIYVNVGGYLLNFAYDYVNSKLNNSKTQQARRPKNTINLNMSKQYQKFNSRLQVIKKSASIDTNANQLKLEGYTLVNYSTQYQYNKKIKLSLLVKNIFNKNYEVAKGYNQLGRTVNLGFNYQF